MADDVLKDQEREDGQMLSPADFVDPDQNDDQEVVSSRTNSH
jgi:hypothetical protein